MTAFFHQITSTIFHPIYLFLMVMGVVSLWLTPKTVWWIVWGMAAALMGWYLGHISPFGLIILAGFTLAVVLYYRGPNIAGLKAVLGIGISAAGVLLYMHFLPGFSNWHLIHGIKVSAASTPYHFYLSADKIIPGIVLLAMGHAMAVSSQWREIFVQSFIPILLLLAVLIGLPTSIGYIKYDPKITEWLVVWLPINLLFVCIIEESLFRGFIQKELGEMFPFLKGKDLICLLIAAAVFGLTHLPAGLTMVGIATIAGLGYGYAYMKTQKIEAAIMVHFVINLIHFFFFTYPALAR